jgi:hypothetical protein
MTQQTAITTTPTGRPRGRPQKYTQEKGRAVLAACAHGFTLEASCRVAGIDLGTVQKWVAADPTFAQQISAAREARAGEVLSKILVAAQDDWKAAEAYLRLTQPQTYNRKIEEKTISGEAKLIIEYEMCDSWPPKANVEMRQPKTIVDAK